MSEKNRQDKNRSETGQSSHNTSHNTSKQKPPKKQPSDKKAKAKKPAPQATLQSWDVELSAHSVALLHYWQAMPPTPHDRPHQEPPRHVPVVPSGHYEKDEDQSPPVQFEKSESPPKTGEACDDAGACGDAEPQ